MDESKNLFQLKPDDILLFGKGLTPNGKNKGNVGAFGAGILLDDGTSPESTSAFDNWRVEIGGGNKNVNDPLQGEVAVVDGQLVLGDGINEAIVRTPVIEFPASKTFSISTASRRAGSP